MSDPITTARAALTRILGRADTSIGAAEMVGKKPDPALTKIRDEARAALASLPPAPVASEGEPLSAYSYQQIFDAISAATELRGAGTAIGVSVDAFRKALAKAAPALREDEAARPRAGNPCADPSCGGKLQLEFCEPDCTSTCLVHAPHDECKGQRLICNGCGEVADAARPAPREDEAVRVLTRLLRNDKEDWLPGSQLEKLVRSANRALPDPVIRVAFELAAIDLVFDCIRQLAASMPELDRALETARAELATDPRPVTSDRAALAGAPSSEGSGDNES